MAGRVFRGLPRAFSTALGEPVEYTPQGGQTVSLSGVFTRDYYAAMENGEVQLDSASPAVSLPAVEVPNAHQGDEVSVQGVDYTVVSVQPDGMGMTALILQEA